MAWFWFIIVLIMLGNAEDGGRLQRYTQGRVLHLASENGDLESKVSDLERKKSDLESNVSDLEYRNRRLKNEVDDLETKVSAYEAHRQARQGGWR